MQSFIDRLNFTFLEALFADALVPKGFAKQGREYDGAFGSHYVDFVNSNKAYRLIADGREFEVILESTENYSASHFGRGWSTQASTAYPATITKESMQECFVAIRNHLVN